MYHVYLLINEKQRTYIGMTNDPIRRLRQHNREIAGGARATHGHIWNHVCVLSGFPTKRSALQFEWMWKYKSRRQSGIIRKMETFVQIWKQNYSSSQSLHFSELHTNFFLSISKNWITNLKKIECFQSLRLEQCGSFHISDYIPFQLYTFPNTSEMSSISNTLTSTAVAAEPKKAQRKPKTEPVAEAAPAPAEEPKKTRKPKTEPVVETASPAVEEPKKPRKPRTKKAAESDAEASAADAAATDGEETKVKKPRTKKAAAAAEAAETSATEGAATEGDEETKVKKRRAKKAAAAEAAVSESEAAATDAEESTKAKKPRKPRTKKAAAAAAADLAVLDEETLDGLDMSGKIALLKDHIIALSKQIEALKSGVGDATARDKKPRKKREPKAKAECPPAADGVIRFHTTLKNDFKALNNSHKADITIDGRVYPSVEHYYQCAKFLDTAPDYAAKICSTSNAALIKNMGRTKKIEMRADWDDVQMDIMRKALRAKFSQHADLAELLRSTGDARLEEESPSDAYWGIGADGEGENHLGTLLEEIRETL